MFLCPGNEDQMMMMISRRLTFPGGIKRKAGDRRGEEKRRENGAFVSSCQAKRAQELLHLHVVMWIFFLCAFSVRGIFLKKVSAEEETSPRRVYVRLQCCQIEEPFPVISPL